MAAAAAGECLDGEGRAGPCGNWLREPLRARAPPQSRPRPPLPAARREEQEPGGGGEGRGLLGERGGGRNAVSPLS